MPIFESPVGSTVQWGLIGVFTPDTPISVKDILSELIVTTPPILLESFLSRLDSQKILRLLSNPNFHYQQQANL
jgi:hypothetical protein